MPFVYFVCPFVPFRGQVFHNQNHQKTRKQNETRESGDWAWI